MNGRKHRGKRALSLALAALMVLSLGPMQVVPGTVYAEETDGSAAELPQPAPEDGEIVAESGEQVYIPDGSGLPDAEELFAGYVMQTFYGDSGISLLSNYGESALEEYDLFLYRELKKKAEYIAANGGSTSFEVTLDKPVTWQTTASGDALKAEAGEKFGEAVHIGTILDCLLADCPYELYWFDKTKGISLSYSISSGGGTASISTLKLSLKVSGAYQGGTDEIVSPDTAGAAAGAAAAAQQIAAKHADKSAYEKMLAFKDEICTLTDYNFDAAEPDYSGGYGDPWQMIYVFDNDPDTKVVCEGYSKAFQYLCDLSGLTCYTVTGVMSGGTGAGGHMWNIVTLGGENYLVDVTNSDSRTAGQGGELFLAGYDSGTWNSQYNFQAGSSTISYTYDEDQVSLYGEGILTLADSDYDPAEQEPQVQVSVSGPENGTVPYGTAPELRVTVTGQGGSGGNITYQWHQYDEHGTAQPVAGADGAVFEPQGLGPGSYRYYCKVVCDGYEITSSPITVTVEKAVLTPSITGTFTKVYDGTADAAAGQGLGITLSGAVSGEDVSASAKSYTYNSKDVADADMITAAGIMLSGSDSGNYRLALTSASVGGSITQRPVTVTPDSGQSKTQGSGDPVLTWTVTGGDLAAGEKLAGALSRAEGETVGTYAITIGTLGTANPNYAVTLGGNVTFEILAVTDSVAPTGEITVAGSSWREFLNTITFGYFFKETQTVTITGQDNSGTEVTIEYLLSDRALTENDLAQMEAGAWTVYNKPFHIKPGSKVIVYARVTDGSGNSTVISSQGIVLYTDAQAVDDQITYTRTGTADVTARITLNGNTVAEIRNGSTPLEADSDYTVDQAAGTVVFKADYLKTLEAGSYTLTVSYDPLGVGYTPAEGSGSSAPAETTLALSVEKQDSSVSDISDISKTYDSEPVGSPTYKSTGTGSVTVEYKEKDADDSTYTQAAPEDAGEYTVRVAIAENSDWNAASASRDFTISRRQATIEGTSVEPTKVYDGTTSAAITGNGTIAGAIAGDEVQIQPGTADYTDKNAGTGKKVAFSGFSLTGADAPNYELTAQPDAGTADITQKELTVAVEVADKLYDGTTAARIDSAELLGVVTGDTVELNNGTASFTSSAVGTGIPVTFTDFTITGADSGNYTLIQPTGVTADIAEYAAEKGTDYTVNSNDWLREDFVVTAGAGRLLSTDSSAEDSAWTGTLSASDETDAGILVFYVKNTETGAVSAAVTETYKIDRTAPEISGISNGGVYYGSAVFTAEDEYLDAVYVDGQEVTVAGEGYTIQADNGSHTVTAYDRAGNSSSCTVYVYRVYIPDGAEEIPQPDAGNEGISRKLLIEKGVTAVPEALKAIEELNTPEKIRTALMTKITQMGVSADSGNTALYDVTLLVDLHDGNGWIPAGPEHFSADGKLTVTLPYPEGTGKDTRNFTVAHMFTSDVFGKRPGDIETPAVTRTENGIQFEVTGLSPIMVSWAEVKAQDVQQGDPGNGSQGETAASVPNTGDPAIAAVYAAVLSISLLAAGTAVCAKKKGLIRRRTENTD